MMRVARERAEIRKQREKEEAEKTNEGDVNNHLAEKKGNEVEEGENLAATTKDKKERSKDSSMHAVPKEELNNNDLIGHIGEDLIGPAPSKMVRLRPSGAKPKTWFGKFRSPAPVAARQSSSVIACGSPRP